MKNVIQKLISLFDQATHKAYPQLDPSFSNEITPSTQSSFGHYQCNSAMKLAKLVQQSPRQVAENILSHLNELKDPESIIEKTDIAGPGFINITLNSSYISKCVDLVLKEAHFGIDLPEKRERIIIDFSSPNVAKEMHVGHLRSTIIGDSLARLFEFLGHDVVRLNHIGDYGTAFGMLIAYMKMETPAILKGQKETSLHELMALYKASKKRFDEDPVFKKNAQQEVVALQQGNAETRKAWKIICEISRKAYQEIYDLLDVKIIERGESFYDPLLEKTVLDLEKRGLVEISEGAKCIFLEGFENREGTRLPLMIQKSDGGYNYDTTDMAAIIHRIEEEKGDRLIYVTDAGQASHFQMIFKAAEKAGYLDPTKVRVDHVPFGLVLGLDGKKFKTRSGETERLIDLLNAAIQRADEILMERTPDMPVEERKPLAHALGIGAVKYADLSCHRVGDYVFSYDRMLKFEGNTAAFLMYAYVRVGGIKRRLKIDPQTLINDKVSIRLEHPSEIALGLHLMQFGETLDKIASDLLPNHMTNYLYLLAEKFNAFFRDCHVEGTPQQNQRLLLCEATSRVLKQGLNILGVPVIERM